MAHAAPKTLHALAGHESPDHVPDRAPDRTGEDFLDLTAEPIVGFDAADGLELDDLEPVEAIDAHDGPGHALPPSGALASHDEVVRAVGSLVCSWGSLERTTMDKLTAMRLAAGDVRLVGGRMRPGMARLLAELRALVSMRDRHDKQGLVVIAELENHIQRIAQFHLLVISGFQASEADILLCRDSKNSERRISLADMQREIATIEMIKERLSAI
ncbi:hypothetical protein LWE61_03625 [Sphingobium sufflavum]|uniref:hypothetical protein n=1 Tax=Sphingobium sufflavum TaxID=1129547 RepID=UPI001F19FD8C|nr:hypothetical protein [Sphingobium sufflavum]MCE7795643.1 hypothetical protein [Sphingobium sufflavum]